MVNTDFLKLVDADSVSSDGRLSGLVVIREAAALDGEVFGAVRAATYSVAGEEPAIKAVADLGMAPLRHPDRPLALDPSSDTAIVVHDIGGSRDTVFFVHRGYGHLWCSMRPGGSRRAKEVFNAIACDAIMQLRPRELVVPSLSNLARSPEHCSLLQGAIRGNVDTLKLGSWELPLVGPQGEVGQIVLAAVAQVAHEHAAMAHLTSQRRRALFGKGRGAPC